MVVFSNKQCLQPSTCWCLRSLSPRSALWKDCSTTLSFPWRVYIDTLQEAIILPLSKSWVHMHRELTSLVFQLFKGLVELRFSRTKGRAFGHSSGKNPSWVFIMAPAHSKMLENWGWRGNIEGCIIGYMWQMACIIYPVKWVPRSLWSSKGILQEGTNFSNRNFPIGDSLVSVIRESFYPVRKWTNHY